MLNTKNEKTTARIVIPVKGGLEQSDRGDPESNAEPIHIGNGAWS